MLSLLMPQSDDARGLFLVPQRLSQVRQPVLPRCMSGSLLRARPS
jgi:hypothetical protein